MASDSAGTTQIRSMLFFVLWNAWADLRGTP